MSRIESGSLILTDIDKNVSLSAGDILHLENARGVISVLEIDRKSTKCAWRGAPVMLRQEKGSFRWIGVPRYSNSFSISNGLDLRGAR